MPNFFTEAGRSLKAIEAAIQCRQFSKAAGIIEFLDHNQALPYFKRIAGHYEQMGNLEEVRRISAQDLHPVLLRRRCVQAWRAPTCPTAQ